MKRGFTLLEVLIVIAILGVIATLAVSGYTQYRRSSLITLAVLDLESQFREAKSRTIYGEFGGDDPKCLGLYLKADASGGLLISTFAQEFSEKKVWNVARQIWEFAGCDGDNNTFFSQQTFQTISIDDGIYLNKIILEQAGRMTTFTGIILRYAPPDGKLELALGAENFASEFGPGAKLHIELAYGEEPTDDERATLTLEL